MVVFKLMDIVCYAPLNVFLAHDPAVLRMSPYDRAHSIVIAGEGEDLFKFIQIRDPSSSVHAGVVDHLASGILLELCDPLLSYEGGHHPSENVGYHQHQKRDERMPGHSIEKQDNRIA